MRAKSPRFAGWRRWLQPETYASKPANPALRLTKKLLVALVGASVLLAGVLMIVTPGPAVVVIPLGLAILAVEFTWARRWLRKVQAYSRIAKRRLRKRRAE